MISKPTVFILGAGAHCPYGLPVLSAVVERTLPKNFSFPASRNGAAGDPSTEICNSSRLAEVSSRYSSPKSLTFRARA
jgi:hypothetical protein